MIEAATLRNASADFDFLDSNMMDSMKRQHGPILDDMTPSSVPTTPHLVLSVAGAGSEPLMGSMPLPHSSADRGTAGGTFHFAGHATLQQGMGTVLPNFHMPHPLMMTPRYGPMGMRGAPLRYGDMAGEHGHMPSPEDSLSSTPSPPAAIAPEELNDDYLYACLQDMSPVTPSLSLQPGTACDGFGLDVFEDIKAEPGVVVRKGSLKAKSNRRKVKSMGTESQLYTEMSQAILNPSSMDSLNSGFQNMNSLMREPALQIHSFDDLLYAGPPLARSHSASVIGARYGTPLPRFLDEDVAVSDLMDKTVARQRSTPKQRKGAKAQQGEDSSGHAGAYGTIAPGLLADDLSKRSGRCFSLGNQRRIVQESLACPETVTTVTLRYTRLVQKSYGTEKRFFCPPPCLVLQGPWTRDLSQITCAIALDKSETGFPFAVDASAKEEDRVCLLARTMFVADSEKAKAYPLQVVFNRYGVSSRLLTSPIRIVSKPSQKKSSRITTAADEMAICSGTYVALFSRIRSQTASTKYMTGNPTGLSVSSSQWDSLVVRAANAHLSDATPRLTYGSPLEIWSGCVLQGTFVPYPVRKLVADPQSHESISELNRMVLMVANTMNCLAVGDNETVRMMPAKAGPDGKLSIPENAVWSIISTDKSSIRFKEPRGVPMVSFSQAPHLTSVQVKDDNQRVELFGSNLGPGYTVWFDDSPIFTELESSEHILCHLNKEMRDAVTNESFKFRRPADNHPLRISLSRDADGVVFIMEGYQMMS